jgi:hypothetical protein
MTDPQPEPELIESSLNRSIGQGGRRLEVHIVRLATERGWSLEVVKRSLNRSLGCDTSLLIFLEQGLNRLKARQYEGRCKRFVAIQGKSF